MKSQFHVDCLICRYQLELHNLVALDSCSDCFLKYHCYETLQWWIIAINLQYEDDIIEQSEKMYFAILNERLRIM